MTLPNDMIMPSSRVWITAMALTTSLAGVSSALAQSTPQTEAQIRARAATSALNGGPAESTLRPRVNAQPPLSDQELPRPVRPVTPPMSQATVRTPPASTTTSPRTPAAQTQTQTPARPAPPQARAQAPAATTPRAPAASSSAGTTAQARANANTRPSTSTPSRRPAASEPEILAAENGVTLAPGETAPPPISMSLGYYVKGDLDCGQVVAGQGQIAWFTPTAFTLDFGGCEPGEFQLTGPNIWREEQKCLTELGNDAGSYTVTYEIVGTDTLKRDTVLDIDGSTESDVWHFCRPETVPSTARFTPRT